MFKIEIGKLKYTYLVGAHTVGIIPPSRHKHIATIQEVRGDRKNPHTGVNNGSCDSILLPEEIAAYILKLRLK